MTKADLWCELANSNPKKAAETQFVMRDSKGDIVFMIAQDLINRHLPVINVYKPVAFRHLDALVLADIINEYFGELKE